MPYFKTDVSLDDKLVCRSCLFSGTNMKFLLQSPVRDAFTDATKIEVCEDDGLPNWLCNYCYSVLLKVIRFKLMATKTNNILKSTMKTGACTLEALPNNSSCFMLTYTTISHNDICDNCDKIPDSLMSDAKSDMDKRKTIELINNENSQHIFNLKSNISHESEIDKDHIKLERLENDFTCAKSYYSSENDSVTNEMKYSPSRQNSVTRKKRQLESENSPLIFIANSLRLARKKKKRALKTLKINKFQNKTPNVSKEINRLHVNEPDKEIHKNYDMQLENSVLQDSGMKSFKSVPKFDKQKKTNMNADTDSYRKQQKKHSKWKMESESKLFKERCVSDKIKNESTVLEKCYMSRVAIIEMNLDEQMKELKIKQDSDQFKSARFKCDKCIKIFPYEDSLKNHMIRHDQSYGSCECSLCGQRFLTSRVLKSHQMAHSKRYRCLECKRILKFKATVTHHMMRHDGTYSCRMCGHLSMNKEANKVHQRTHTHLDIYNCPLCPKVLGSKQDYGIHMRRHSGDMPFECSECAKLFLTNAALQSHRAVHSTARHFYCAECDVSFKTKDIMLTHFRKSSRHVDPALLRFQCDLCPKRFPSKETLASHSDSYHTRCAKLACDACPARFVSANGLRNHKKTVHEGFRPSLSHVCEACGRAFSTKALVTNHLRTHTGEQPFECPTCQRRFSQRSAMQTHIKLVHLKIKRNMSIPKDKLFSAIQSEHRLPLDSSPLVKMQVNREDT